MTPKQLAYKTADYIEANPELYDFMKVTIPKRGSPGCVIGLAGMLAGDKSCVVSMACLKLFEMDISELSKELHTNQPWYLFFTSWVWSSYAAVKALRAWADTLPDEELEPALVKFMSTLEVEQNVNAMSAS